MFYDWLPGGWGGRNGKDGSNDTTACFGTGLMSQPVEGQERANPILTTECEILTDSPGPGKWRGGAGVMKTSRMLQAEKTVISYICDRERAVVWGIEGGLPSMPHGLTLKRAGANATERLGSIFSDVPIGEGDIFSRPTAGGGGFGDPLDRDPALVIEDIKDDYVSIERAAKDYGVVVRTIDAELCEYEVDKPATETLRAKIRAERVINARLDPEIVAEKRYRSGALDTLDVIPPARRDPRLGHRRPASKIHTVSFAARCSSGESQYGPPADVSGNRAARGAARSVHAVGIRSHRPSLYVFSNHEIDP